MNLARRERLALCDLALDLGPSAPTLCDGWDARDLVAHLLVREHSPLGSLGIPVPRLSGFTDKAMARASRGPFPAMVERLRTIGLTPYRLPGIEWLANTAEFVIHHEDLRRGQAGWEPRELPRADEDTLWTQLRFLGRAAAKRAGVPLVVRRSDTGDSVALSGGESPALVIGRPSELVLLFAGRRQLRGLDYDGDDRAVERFRATDLSM